MTVKLINIELERVISYSAHCMFVKPVLRRFSVLGFICQLKELIAAPRVGNEPFTYATTNLLPTFNTQCNTHC